MKEKMYLADNIAIIDYDKTFPTTKSGLIRSEEFHRVLIQFLQHLKKKDADLYAWACRGGSEEDAAAAMSHLARTIIVFDLDEISDPYLDGSDNAL